MARISGRLTALLAAQLMLTVNSTIGTGPAWGQAAPASGGPVEAAVIEDLVAASRILADQGVLDGFGHVSVRHPADASRFLMPRSLAPALTRAEDVLEYDLECRPVDARGRSSFLERFIHCEVYKARPDVRSVIHTHSPGVIPFAASSVPLRPMYHVAGFLAAGVPIFEIRKHAGMTNMLVSCRSPYTGRSTPRSMRACRPRPSRSAGLSPTWRRRRARRPTSSSSRSSCDPGSSGRPRRWGNRRPCLQPAKISAIVWWLMWGARRQGGRGRGK
jgi:hypothetical protein